MNNQNKEEHLKSMSLGDHLEELRARLILIILGLFIGLVVCLFFGKDLIAVMSKPFNQVIRNLQEQGVDAANDTAVIVTHGPVEGFMVYIKTCMLFGLLFTSPWVIWQIWAFVSAGLYQKEKRYVRIVAPVSAFLFITGTLFFILGVAPQMMGFLIKFDAAIGVRSFWSLQKYINMVFALTLVFGAAFQMPIAIVFAEHLGLISIDTLAQNRKFVALGLVIVAAMATPPDVISQVSLAIPLYGLYEASIIFCRLKKKRKSTAN